jgi:hypothetical protein
MPRLGVAHDIRRQWLAGRRTLCGRPLTCRLTLLRRRPLLNRRAVLRRTALLSGLALLRSLALLRRRTLLGCLALLCPITNRITPDLIATQTLAECGARRRTGGSGSGQPPESLTPAAFLQSLASLR